jgi:hypothetical protein
MSGQERKMLDEAHRNFAARKYDLAGLMLLITEGHIEMVPTYTEVGSERAETLKLLERSE